MKISGEGGEILQDNKIKCDRDNSGLLVCTLTTKGAFGESVLAKVRFGKDNEGTPIPVAVERGETKDVTMMATWIKQNVKF